MSPAESDTRRDTAPARLPILRSGIGGVLMGLANLVPGVSGGTMILVVGLYDEFISSMADVTRLRFTRRNVAFLLIVGGAAAAAIATMAGVLREAVTGYRCGMYSLFIGLTLGGVPLLARMVRRVTVSSGVGLSAGLAVMGAIAVTSQEPAAPAAIQRAVVADVSVSANEFVIQPHYARDVAAGALGMSAMVLPGISGAYMFLVLGRYETILASIDRLKRYAVSLGGEGDPAAFLRIIIPVALGAVLGLVLLSNFLKWMLHRHQSATIGFLLGILLGSVVGIWPFTAASPTGDYVLGMLLAAAGFTSTFLLSRNSV